MFNIFNYILLKKRQFVILQTYFKYLPKRIGNIPAVKYFAKNCVVRVIDDVNEI